MLALLLLACGISDPLVVGPVESSAEPPAALAAPPASAITASLQELAPQELPDGLGGRVAADAPVALSLGGGWGGRAQDPVLVVGARRFTDYDHPAPGVLRFTLPERGVLDEGPARVQWADDDFVDVSAAVGEALR